MKQELHARTVVLNYLLLLFSLHLICHSQPPSEGGMMFALSPSLLPRSFQNLSNF